MAAIFRGLGASISGGIDLDDRCLNLGVSAVSCWLEHETKLRRHPDRGRLDSRVDSTLDGLCKPCLTALIFATRLNYD